MIIKQKYNMDFVSFIIYTNIYENEELRNLELTINFLQNNFNAGINILEIGVLRKIPQNCFSGKIKVHYFQDNYYKCFYLNKIIKEIESPVLVFWQNGLITNPQNIYNAAIRVKENPLECVIPHNGQILYVPKPIRDLYCNTNESQKYIYLNEKKLIPVFGNFSSNGGIFVNKHKYGIVGFENPNISNFENTWIERQKRLEIVGMKMKQYDGNLYSFNNSNGQMRNQFNKTEDQKEVLKICQMNCDGLKKYISSWHKNISLKKQLINWQYNNFKTQKKELKHLYTLLKPKYPFLFDFNWSTYPDFLKVIVSKLQKEKPITVVECGSGVSTIVSAYIFKKNNQGHIFSLEHDKLYYNISKNEIKRQQIEEYITLIYAPLKIFKIKGKMWTWYDTSEIKKRIKKIDFLLVDGPPGFLQKHSRYPAFPVLKKFFHKNTAVVLDDSDRPDEREIVNRWLLENPEYCVSHLKTVKGMCILKQKI